jgi:tetrapyrrole methylase family protein/MazG family protein
VQTIIALGLGPGRWQDLTLAAREVLDAATTIYVRTLRHPVIPALRRHYPQLIIHSFDDLSAAIGSWDALYPAIASELCALARMANAGEPVIYAVPGHPLVGEESVRLLRTQAREQGIALRIVAGLSMVEPALAALDLDPFAGLQLLDATQLAGLERGELAGMLLPSRPVVITQVQDRRLASALRVTLADLYPDDWQIQLVQFGDETSAPENGEQHGGIRITALPLHTLGSGAAAGDSAILYLPPLPPLTALRTAATLRSIVARLRAPDGCPWDRQQTHQSLKPFVLEEAYEVADTLEDGDTVALAEELGDLLLQVYLHAEIARQADEFALEDVFAHISSKLIRRHPHVFGDIQVRDAAQVLQNWETIKRAEREAKGEDVAGESALRPIPRHTPALAYAYELQRQAAKTGFEWTDQAHVLAKIREEIAELTAADAEQAEEWGDLLFALVGLARWRQINPEDALRAAGRKFAQRFRRMETLCRERGQRLDILTAAQWQALWQEAKQQ